MGPNFAHMVGFENGQHKFLYQKLSTWVCKLSLPSHFLFPNGHALMLKKQLMYKQHKSRSALCVTLSFVLLMYPHPLVITLKIGKGYYNIILHMVAHPKDLVLYVCKRYANILVVESF